MHEHTRTLLRDPPLGDELLIKLSGRSLGKET